MKWNKIKPSYMPRPGVTVSKDGCGLELTSDREYWVNLTVMEFMQTLSTCSEFKDLVHSNADTEALQRIVDKAIRVGVELRSQEV